MIERLRPQPLTEQDLLSEAQAPETDLLRRAEIHRMLADHYTDLATTFSGFSVRPEPVELIGIKELVSDVRREGKECQFGYDELASVLSGKEIGSLSKKNRDRALELVPDLRSLFESMSGSVKVDYPRDYDYRKIKFTFSLPKSPDAHTGSIPGEDFARLEQASLQLVIRFMDRNQEKLQNGEPAADALTIMLEELGTWTDKNGQQQRFSPKDLYRALKARVGKFFTLKGRFKDYDRTEEMASDRPAVSAIRQALGAKNEVEFFTGLRRLLPRPEKTAQGVPEHKRVLADDWELLNAKVIPRLPAFIINNSGKIRRGKLTQKDIETFIRSLGISISGRPFTPVEVLKAFKGASSYFFSPDSKRIKTKKEIPADKLPTWKDLRILMQLLNYAETQGQLQYRVGEILKTPS